MCGPNDSLDLLGPCGDSPDPLRMEVAEGIVFVGDVAAPTGPVQGSRTRPCEAVPMNARDLMEAAGITYRELDYWTRVGYLRAEPRPEGSGYDRDFPAGEVTVAVTIRRLRDAGVKVAVAARVARNADGFKRPVAERLGVGVTVIVE